MAKTTHGMYATNTYKTWSSMIGRCRHKGNASYKRYGASGITVCERWMIFLNFLEDMGVRPDGKTLDRIEGTKGYFKENCRWADKYEQAGNIKSNNNLAAFGLTMNASAWGRRVGIPHETIRSRIRKGMSVEEAVSRPLALTKSRTGPRKKRAVVSGEAVMDLARQIVAEGGYDEA